MTQLDGASQFDLRLFTLVLFHYDTRVDAWDDQPWFEQAIHVRSRPLRTTHVPS